MTFQLLEDYAKCGKDAPSLLLWLSSIRKLFTANTPGGACDISQDRGLPLEKIQSSVLAQYRSLAPLLISLMSHENQFVCYLTSKVLHLLSVASQSITEGFLQQVVFLVPHGAHVCLYCLQMMKDLLKSVRKSSAFSEAVADYVVPFMSSHWKMIYTDVRAKLEDRTESKWPELNFNIFLSLSIEMLHHCKTDSSTNTFDSIAEHLEDLSSTVSQHCNSPTSLKVLLKMYTNLMKLAKTPETRSVIRERLMQCVPKLFMCESELIVRTCGLVMEAVREDENEGRDSVSMEKNLYRTIARRVVLFLMQYATLMDSEAYILTFECTLRALCHQCDFKMPTLSDPAGMQAVRHALFQLLNEQDDAILQLLTSSSELWKRKSLWASQQHPVLQLFFSATHLHFMLVEFMESVCYDHSVLLDFIVSPEVSKFEEFLADYLETCCADWSALSAACQELELHVHTLDCNKPVVGTMEHYSPTPLSSSSDVSPSSPPEAVYQETTLDKVMDCFTRLGFALERLCSSKLLPCPVDRLSRALTQAETLYESSASS